MAVSPYLEAIQNVSGSTPGEKYKTLNCIARKIIAQSNGQNDMIQVEASSELPDILIPLVKVEIAIIIRQPDEIVNALKSYDNLVFDRALRAKWFFDGSMEDVTNVHYFNNYIFNCISVKNRHKLIKKLSIHLTNSTKYNIAEEFYVKLLNSYGVKVSMPLFVACSEEFIWSEIINRKLILSVEMAEKLFIKYPNLIINYLQLENFNRDHQYVCIMKNEYGKLLPRLLKNHTDIFIKLIDDHGGIVARCWGRRATVKFLKIGFDLLIKYTKEFASSINMKLLTSNLTKEQFKLFFRNLFPKSVRAQFDSFDFMKMYKYLEYYPKDEAVSLLLTTFEEVYKENFLNYDDLVDANVIILLSPEQRVQIARIKLKKDPKLIKRDYKLSWTVYLPIDESIVIIKDYIKKSDDITPEGRGECLKEMIYSCKVNDDYDALLNVLKYITARHRNERNDILIDVMDTLLSNFHIENFPPEHWKILDNIVQMLYVKDKSHSGQMTIKNLIVGKIHYNLIHNLPITEQIRFYFNIDTNSYYNWNILTDNIEYERKCLDEFLNAVPTYLLCPVIRSKLIRLVDGFIEAIYSFNQRNLKPNSNIEKISIRNYPWLLIKIEELLSTKNTDINSIKWNLNKCDPDFYHVLLKKIHPEYKDELIIDLSKFNELKKNPEKILKHWEKYLKRCKYDIHSRYARRFVKMCRWYQNIPIKFVKKCLTEFTEDSNAVMILALLLEGSAFEQMINPYLPTIDFKGFDDDSYFIIELISRALYIVNLPISLNITLKYCTIDLVHMIDNWFAVLSRRTSIDEIIPFAINLIDQPVCISKHAIRMCCTAASIDQLQILLIDLWRGKNHHSIRTLIFDKIIQLFVDNPSDKTWSMMCECLDGLTIDDKVALNSVLNISQISNLYVMNYVRKLLKIFQTFQCNSDNDDTENSMIVWSYIVTLIKRLHCINIDIDDEFHQEILETYFSDLFLPFDISNAIREYIFTVYINQANDNFQSRLNFFSNIFIDILKTKWDIPHPDDNNAYPANNMIFSMSFDVMWQIKDNNKRIKFADTLLKAFSSVLKPYQEPTFYLNCFFTSLYRDNMSIKEYANRICENISSLIEAFSIEFVVEIAKILTNCLRCLFIFDNISKSIYLDVIESLLEFNNEHAAILAAKILMINEEDTNYEQYNRIIKILRQQKNLSILANISMKINKRVLKIRN